MKKFAIIINFLFVVFANSGLGFSNSIDDGDYSLRYLIINVPPKNVLLNCGKSSPKDDTVFFEIYVDDGEHLYDLFTRSPLKMKSCPDMVRESEKIIKKKDFVALLGEEKMPTRQIKPQGWKNDLLKKYQGRIHAMSFFSQISNGKSCKCWFEGCHCLPIKDGTKVDIIRNYQG